MSLELSEPYWSNRAFAKSKAIRLSQYSRTQEPPWTKEYQIGFIGLRRSMPVAAQSQRWFVQKQWTHVKRPGVHISWALAGRDKHQLQLRPIESSELCSSIQRQIAAIVKESWGDTGAWQHAIDSFAWSTWIESRVLFRRCNWSNWQKNDIFRMTFNLAISCNIWSKITQNHPKRPKCCKTLPYLCFLSSNPISWSEPW